MKVKFSRCNSSDLASLPLVDGQLTYVKDTGENYLDVGATRNKISDMVFLDNDEALEQIENPLSSKFYYVKSSKKLMYYNGTDYDTLNEVDVSAEDVHFTSTEGITATNVQDAFEQIETKVNSNTTNITSAQSSIQENADNISTIQQQVSSIITKNNTQDETLGQLQTSITSMQEDIQDLKENVPTDDSFTELTNRVSAVEAKNTTQDTNIKDLQDKDKSQDTLISGLQSNVGTLQSSLDTAEENIATIQGDITDIKEKDSTQDTSIQALQTSVGNVESDVTKVKGDISTLQATTGQHTTDITGLKKDVSTIKDSVGTNTSDISSLKTRVTTNENDIDTLQSSVEGINTNITSIEGNIDTVEGSVSTLQQTVSGHTTDITDLKSKVQKNTTNITSLQGNVSTLQGDLDTVEENVSTLQTSVSGLQSSVSINTQNIATNTQSIESIQEAMASTQHFRGYYQTIAEITELEGHTGDFAYCAEDEFKYVYNGEQWVKTDEAVPDQTVEKTTILPLMNGTATIGTDNRYAPGNHVHPTDTTRASVEALEAHTTNTSNPHNVTKTQIGLGNVDNTSDLNKPISTATQSALNNKVDKVTGKGLSTEDYTTAEKEKLATLNNYNDTEVKADITKLQSNVGTLQSDVSTAKENISTLQKDVTGIKGNVSTLTQSVSTLDTTVEGLETDVTELQGTVSDVEETVGTLQINLNNKVDKVQGKGLSTNDFTNTYKTKLDGLNNYDDTTVKQDIRELQTDVGALETTVGNHTKSIETNTTDITTLKGNVQTLQTNLGNKVDKVTGKGLSTEDYTTTEKNKLAGIEANANNYTLPKASGTVLGGIKIGNNLNIDENGVVSATDTNTTYTAMKGATSSTAGTSGLVPAPQQGQQNSFLKGDGTWGTVESASYGEATQDQSGLMSANDKKKLDNIEANANNYTLPVATTTRLGGVKAGNNITISGDGTISATDTNTTYEVMEGATSEANGQSGLVPAPTQGQQTRFLRGDGTWQIPTNTTYTNATTSKAGLMSATDKTKLDGIEDNANNYVHPTTPGNKHIPSGGSTGQVLKWSADGTAVWGTDNDTTYINATTSKAGLMSATDKTKLDSLQNFDDSTIQENIGDLQSSVSTLESSVSTIEESLGNKVDKVSGKQLSTNDYTTTEKTKLSGIATGATKVEKSNTNGNIKINGTETTVYTKPDLTKQEVVDALGYTPPTTNTTYSVMTGATSSQAGTSGLVPQPTAGKQTSFLRGDGTWVVPTNTTYTNATTEKDGLMSSEDKTKLDNIEAGDTTPLANGTATAGTSNSYAREDHRHPLQTTVSGNAGTATKLQTARTIGLSGAATGTATSFDGTANITIPVTSLDASKLTGTASINTTGNASTSTTCTGNAATATKLQTARKINGVAFDGTQDITVQASGTGGHIILNSSGSSMEARSKLRFNHSTVTDDEENDVTIITPTDTTYSVATTSKDGLMSSSMVTKLNGIATGATKNSASDTTPKANGTASVGTETDYARGDHVHPLQTTVSGNAGSATKLQTARTISLSGAVTGSTTFDGSANRTITTTLSNIDASKITSGTIDIARLPAAALERCVVVADDTARFKLTSSDVQLGDTVKVTDTNKMYMVTNTSELDNANGYTEFSAGHASTADTATRANQLTTARTINGTSFNGTANITTANWGTARNIGIVNSDGTGTAVTTSVNGSGNVNLKLPATIKASLTGNATTASTLATARTIGLSGVTATAQSFNGSKNITIPITAVPASLLTGTASINTTGNAATADRADTATTATTATNATNVRYTLQNPTSSSTYVVPFASGVSTGNKATYINDGITYNTLEGTTSVIGYGTLILGNSTKSGTAANKYGQLRLYGTSSGYTQIKAGSSTSNYTLTLPDATDTLVGLTTSQALTNKTYNGYTLAAACAKGVVTTVDTSSNLPTSNAVKTFVEGKGYKTTDNNYYPTTWAWTNGTTSGPTARLTGSGMSAVSVAAIPAASGTTQSGIVTTGAQTFGGQKTFSSSPKLSTNTITTSGGYTVSIPNATSTLVNLSTSQGLTNKTYNGLTLTESTSGFTIKGGSTTERTLTVNGNYTLNAACAKAVDTSITKSTTSTNLPTSAAVANLVKSVSGCTTQATSLTCTLPDNL